MKCDSWAFFRDRTLASPCFGRKPKVRLQKVGHNGTTQEEEIQIEES
jgi:hypothetical protein